jgi:hypothetical protein
MMKKAKVLVEKQRYRNSGWFGDWLEKFMAENRRDKREPHEKVIDTTFDRAPEFYDGLKTLVTDDPQAECKKGLEHLHHSEYMEAHVCFLKAAKAGCSEGCYRLGSLYLYGRGVACDYNLAEVWFRAAAQSEYAVQATEALVILERFRKAERRV